MWNRPQLMTEVADLLFMAGAAALLAAGAIGIARLPFFPVREVVVANVLREVRGDEIQKALAGRLRGNFFSVDLETVREALEQLPWVRRAEARRRWPAGIELRIEEQVPVAFWGQNAGRLINGYGEIFNVGTDAPPRGRLPTLNGPANFIPEMLAYHNQAVDLLKPIGRAPRELNVSARLALRMRLDDGTVVELGRSQTKAPVRERLARFAEYYPSVLATGKTPEVVDMRYPNGFALRSAESESRGKP